MLRWLFRKAKKGVRDARRERQWQSWVAMRTEVSERGEVVASRAERRIADLLHAIAVPYEHEARIGPFRPDFYLPQWDLIIEFWGMDPPGSENRRRKVAYYMRGGHALINLEAEDRRELEHVLLRKLYRWDQGVFRRYEAATGRRF